MDSVSSRSVSFALIGRLALCAAATGAALFALQRHPAALRVVPAENPIAKIITRTLAPAPLSAFDKEAALTPGALLDRWNPIVADAARRFHVPQAWIRAVMSRESGGRLWMATGKPIISDKGALGLMQVLPETYAEMRTQYGLGADPFNPHDNIFAGAAYLRWLHMKYGYPAMFAAYNAGPGRLEAAMSGGPRLPAETRAYVGGIAHTLDPKSPKQGFDAVAQLTQPDGTPVKIDANAVTAVRAALPGEYAPGVQAVISLGKRSQGVRETVAAVTAAVNAARI